MKLADFRRDFPPRDLLRFLRFWWFDRTSHDRSPWDRVFPMDLTIASSKRLHSYMV